MGLQKLKGWIEGERVPKLVIGQTKCFPPSYPGGDAVVRCDPVAGIFVTDIRAPLAALIHPQLDRGVTKFALGGFVNGLDFAERIPAEPVEVFHEARFGNDFIGPQMDGVMEELHAAPAIRVWVTLLVQNLDLLQAAFDHRHLDHAVTRILLLVDHVCQWPVVLAVIENDLTLHLPHGGFRQRTSNVPGGERRKFRCVEQRMLWYRQPFLGRHPFRIKLLHGGVDDNAFDQRDITKVNFRRRLGCARGWG